MSQSQVIYDRMTCTVKCQFDRDHIDLNLKIMYRFSSQFSISSLREGIERKTADEKKFAGSLENLTVTCKISMVTSMLPGAASY